MLRCRPGSLEQWRGWSSCGLLEKGIDIYVAGAPADTIGVDTEEDLQRAEAVLKHGSREFAVEIGIARKNRSVCESNLGDDESMTNNVQFATVVAQ